MLAWLPTLPLSMKEAKDTLPSKDTALEGISNFSSQKINNTWAVLVSFQHLKYIRIE